MSAVQREPRFVRLSPQSVVLCAERVGVQTSEEVAGALVEDVSFRIRQITDVAVQFMRHACRRHLAKEDIDKALKWSSVEPLHGLTASEPSTFFASHEHGIFSINERELSLLPVALSSSPDSYTLPHNPAMKASWIAVEGMVLGGAESLAGVSPLHLQLKAVSGEDLQHYLALLLQAVTGEAEDLRRVALLDVQCNAVISNLLPSLTHYLQEALCSWSQYNASQLQRLLSLLLALFRNSNLFLEPYAPSLFSPLHALILTPTYGHDKERHWHLREMAAMAMAEVVRKCGSPLMEFPCHLYSSLSQLMSQSSTPLSVLHGSILTLCHIGGRSLWELLLPRLEMLSGHVHSVLELKSLDEREAALRISETLLLVAELLLTATDLPPLPSPVAASREQLAGFSHSSTLPGPSNADAGLFPSSFAAAMDDSTTEMAAMAEPAAPVPTLYGFLEDIFGERLSQRLCAQPEFQVLPTLAAGHVPQASAPGLRPIPAHLKPMLTLPQVDKSLSNFLCQEGFAAIGIRLPSSAPQPPSVQRARMFHHMTGRLPWGFTLSRSFLPVKENPLEWTDVRGKRRLPCQRGHSVRGMRVHMRRGRGAVVSDLNSWL